jgi:predicted membrane protein DUF2142
VDGRALACALLAAALLVAGIAHALSQRAPRRAGTDGVFPAFPLPAVAAGATVCQGEELLPAGTASISFPAMGPPAGQRLALTLRRGRRLLARATGVARPAGAVVPLPATTARDLDGVEICFTVGPGPRVGLIGGPTPPDLEAVTIGGRGSGGSLPFTYVRAGRESWWERASAIATRIGMGRGDWGGRWIAGLLIALLLASIGLTARALWQSVLREPPPSTRRLPAIAGTVAAVAVLNAAAWSIVTPAFQVPDEQTHIAYAQYIVEQGQPPDRRSEAALAPELVAAMRDTRFGELGRRTFGTAVWSPLQQRTLERDLHAGLGRRGRDAGPAAPEPPLFYTLEAIPYRLASGATLLDRIAAMRLLSALLSGVTALCAFLFVRECLPRRPWAWTVGGLGVAFQPVLGFVTGGVNPDALLFAVCAALFLALARAFRRGLTTRLALAIGIVLGVGAVGKINFYGIVPGAIAALVLAARMTEGRWNGRIARLVGIAVGVGAAPYVVLTAFDALLWNRTLILARTPAELPVEHGDLGGQFSYVWQVFFPRLPGQTTAFHDFYPGWQLWFKGFVGRFGWSDVQLPLWCYRLAAAAFALIGVLGVRALVARRATLRRRWIELLGYALVGGSLLALIGAVALRGWAPGIAGAVQGRYLLPLLVLFGGWLALAARGAGERWGRAVGAVIVVAAIGWTLVSQLVVIGFFYG